LAVGFWCLEFKGRDRVRNDRDLEELARFVRVASELDYHLLLSHDFGYLQPDEHQMLSQELTRVRKMLAWLLSTLKSGTKAKTAAADA
jgi:four helix bundle protein